MASSNTTSLAAGVAAAGKSKDNNITGDPDAVVPPIQRYQDTSDQVIGTGGDDNISSGYTGQQGNGLDTGDGDADKVNGNSGSDQITTGDTNDLGAGDMVGGEWQYVDGEWVYDASAVVVSDLDETRSYDDVIVTGAGNDVLLGNGGDDELYAGAGDDRINAGRGDDIAFGGSGNDKINLESGDDYAEGGVGDDTVNGGSGNDTIFGDVAGSSVLDTAEGATSLSDFGASGLWQMAEHDGFNSITQQVETNEDGQYELSFEMAANLGAGVSSGQVEVLWNGEVVGSITATSGVFETHTVTLDGQASASDLTFRVLDPEPDPDAPVYNFDGPIVSYDTSVTLGGEELTVQAFAPGQANLYQVIQGQFNVYDTELGAYTEVGPDPGFRINSIGYNTEDDLIYGVAKSAGFDALGNPVSTTDLVMIDATGSVYRVGDAQTGSYTGDFDSEGNLWAFQGSLNSVKVIDVDNLDANGDPQVTHINLPNDVFYGNMCDISYNPADGMFYSVMPPSTNGGVGKVYQIDMRGALDGGDPIIKTVDITGTLYNGEMVEGMTKGAYGAVFLDGDGNLYYGLNNGDHDLGTMGAQAGSGAIFKVNVDWDTGQAYSEFMAEAERTGSNDGAVDPRSADAFTDTDTEDTVLLRNIELVESGEGGNDDLRGGTGDDLIHGNEGNDTLSGGGDDDILQGDEGDDHVMGGSGNDQSFGGVGDDMIIDKGGNDLLDGGAGQDYLNAGSGSDTLLGGAGDDKLVGNAGADVIEGGAGNDHMWGGNWTGDGATDTFVVAAGGGKDFIHDFETDHDVIDLSAYGIEFEDLQSVMSDKGWATEINLSALNGGQSGDLLFLKSVELDDLDESNFVL